MRRRHPCTATAQQLFGSRDGMLQTFAVQARAIGTVLTDHTLEEAFVYDLRDRTS